MTERFREFVRTQRLFGDKDLLLLAVSGGVDSIVLAELCHRCNFRFVIAHANFSLRGTESDRDESFVATRALHYHVPFLQQRFDTMQYADERGVSIQVAARELRYNWFRSLIADPGSPAFGARLLTAHHLDDNIETSLMNFVKGTGIRGLRGMLPATSAVIRPLLFASRREIEAFGRAEQLEWVEDSSNASTKYARNFLRHEILPRLSEAYPDAPANLARNLQRFRDTELLFSEAVARHLKKLLHLQGDEIHIPVLALLRLEARRTILHEILQPYGFTVSQEEEVLALGESESGRYVSSATHRVIRNRAWLIIAPLTTGSTTLIVIDGPGTYSYPGGTLTLETFPQEAGQGLPVADRYKVHVDMRHLRFPLLLRRAKAGDYFYPLGMEKKKKLARFFIDNKLSATAKEKVWVLESDKKIVWVIGMRIDHRFRHQPSTEQLLCIEHRP